ncbi:MAG TPA: hypothetical protein VJT73_20700 [Polyangiaceae bacterium]|nr:hypothetical protein [Polyangiaceae bacterium]
MSGGECLCTITETAKGITCTIENARVTPAAGQTCDAACKASPLSCTTTGPVEMRMATGVPATGMTTDGGSTRTDASGAGPGTVGSPCASSASCAKGLTCLGPSDNLGPGLGFPNGVCTVDCTTSPSICAPLNGVCVNFEDSPTAKGYCMEACFSGPPAAGENKCHTRPDTACEPLDAAGMVQACLPICTDDGDCGGTRKCDLGTGFCRDMVPTGDPVGTPCMANTPATTPETCLGFCSALPGTKPVEGGPPVPGRCTSLCTIGVSVEGCGYRTGPANVDPPFGACVLVTSENPGAGDVGLCAQLCDTVADCKVKGPGWVCDMSLKNRFKHGVCLYQPDADAAPPAQDAAAPPAQDAASGG